jgi:Uncharacterized phage-associated protein
MSHNIHFICDYIIQRCEEANVYLDLLKLQKLLYYCQAWNLAYRRGRLFEGEFQAWIHGPVSRVIYDRFIYKGMYSKISANDVNPSLYTPSFHLPEDEAIISAVLQYYGQFTGDQLEYLTHTEQPWINARQGYLPTQRCENIISDEDMCNYYGQRISSATSR